MEEEQNIEELIQKYKKDVLSNDDLIKIIETVVENNPSSVTDFKEGKDRAIKFLMGMIMKETKGTANPQDASALLLQTLKKY